MNNKIIFYIFIIVIITFFNSCTTVREGLSGKKKDGSDVFMVKKKNPLIVPKEYNELPKPANEENENENAEVDNLNKKVRSLFNNLFKKSGNETDISMSGQPLEKSILKKIKEN